MDMNSEVSKWMSLESAVCFPNQSEEVLPTKTEEEEEEKERFKRPRTSLDNENDVEEFMTLLDRIEETKKLFKRKSMNFSGSSISSGGAVEGDQMLTAPPLMHQPQGLSDAGQSSTSPWKASFQWEDFNLTNSVSPETDLSGAAGKEKNKEAEESVQKGNGPFKTRSFLDVVTPAECSHDHGDNVNNEEDDVEAPAGLELQLFSCR